MALFCLVNCALRETYLNVRACMRSYTEDTTGYILTREKKEKFNPRYYFHLLIPNNTKLLIGIVNYTVAPLYNQWDVCVN